MVNHSALKTLVPALHSLEGCELSLIEAGAEEEIQGFAAMDAEVELMRETH